MSVPLFFALYCLEAGLFLIVVPWTRLWTFNPLLHSSAAMVMLSGNPFVRGFVSGFGVAHLHAAAPQLLRGIVAIVLYVILFASLFNSAFNINVTGYLAGGAVIAAVLALALQDTLGNLFAGIALHMEETYEIGDVIHTGDYMGVVD